MFKESSNLRIQALHQKIIDKTLGNEKTPQSRLLSSPQTIVTSNLPQLDPLTFSGKIEDYLEFKFSWIARFGRLDNDIQVQYLKPTPKGLRTTINRRVLVKTRESL